MSLNWKYRDHPHGESATAFYAGLKLTVQDCDGDGCYWTLHEGDQKLANGDCHFFGSDKPDYFEHAQGVAEEAARIIGRHRKAAQQNAEQSA